jgi:SpoVK/Ycf46/Vps4 family AAA+-type ATPase
MLPLKRPELFTGGLLKPCRGILLFGPPGTGKTMLAKAIANEAGATFLNISMSTVLSKYYGEAEKIIRALFSLAAKLAPAIVFIDEVDSMLGRRDQHNENELPRRVKNEFMTHWDGLLSKTNERILVLAATNRPFDLDEAIVRRFEHRFV